MKQKYKVEGLTCSNCASKIEAEILKFPDVDSASINIAKGTLLIDSRTSLDSTELSELASDIEKGVVIHHSDDESHQHSSAHSATIPRVIIAIALAVLAYYFFKGPFQLLIFIAAYLIVGYDIISAAIRRIIKGNLFDENFLMSLATLGAFLIGEYPEAVAVMAFYQIGEYFQDRAVDHSRRQIAEKMDLRQYHVTKLSDGVAEIVAPEILSIGDIIKLNPHQYLPVDGIVIGGESDMQTASITGESKPRYVSAESEVLSGFINGDQALTIRVVETYQNSTTAKIIELVENASDKKAKSERFITRFAKVYTPIVVIAAIIVATIPYLLGFGSFDTWLYRALIFLVISCPCALVLSVPLSFFAGLGATARQGVVIKGGNHLEKLKEVTTFIFDKTGTLTVGDFKLVDIVLQPGVNKAQFLQLIKTLEKPSEHPIARALKDSLKEQNIQDLDMTFDNYRESPGLGIIAQRGEMIYRLGNDKLMSQINVKVTEVKDQYTRVHLAKNHQYLGYVMLTDRIKDGAKDVVDYLKGQNKQVMMISGDGNQTVTAIAGELDISAYYGEALPHEKLEVVNKSMLNNNHATAFIGDGSNDAPVLAAADLGIAMGGVGTDIAIEVADIIIMNDDLASLPKAIKISDKTMKIVYQNIVMALGIKLIVMVLGIFGYANMWLAVFSDVGVALLAVLNALRILRTRY